MKAHVIRDRPASETQGNLIYLWADQHPELHQPLPHHQTSLIRLNHHANGGKK